MNKTQNTYGIQNKVVVVTGASSGAGRAIAIAFAQNGAKLVLAARRQAALDSLVEECTAFGAQAIAVITDVTSADAMKELAQRAVSFGGAIHVWVNNAGVLAAGPFEQTPVAVHDEVIRINLMGYLHGAHAVLPYFKEQGYGTIINNISIGGYVATPYAAGYAASKFGLRGLSQALKGELSSWPHIHVCDVYPAFLDTPGIQHAANYTGHYIKPSPPVYDPQRIAKAVIRLVQHPKSTVTIGSVARILRVVNFLLPAITRNSTARVIESYLKVAPPMAPTSGNVLDTVEYGTTIHGGWNSQVDADNRKKTGALILAGVLAGILLLRRNT